MEEHGRTMGLDVGAVRIGVALSDPLGIIAQPYTVIRCASPEEDAEAVREIAVQNEVARIVVGLPLDLEGKPGPQARKVLAFADTLRRIARIDVATQDERYSTAAAERSLIDAGMRRRGRKQVIDKVAAQHILQTYLDRRARERTGPKA